MLDTLPSVFDRVLVLLVPPAGAVVLGGSDERDAAPPEVEPPGARAAVRAGRGREPVDERDEGDLRGVGHVVEHRLGGKESADRHAVRAAGESTFAVPFAHPRKLSSAPVQELRAAILRVDKAQRGP